MQPDPDHLLTVEEVLAAGWRDQATHYAHEIDQRSVHARARIESVVAEMETRTGEVLPADGEVTAALEELRAQYVNMKAEIQADQALAPLAAELLAERDQDIARGDDWLARVAKVHAAMPLGELRQREGFSLEVKKAVWIRDGGRCRHCGMTDDEAVRIYGEHLHYDHVIPFSLNGADTEGNCQLLCRGCDLAKGNRFSG
jgi:hypothetical protein